MSQDARSYFPGNGRDSKSAAVQDLIDEMEDACAANDDDAYTDAWFQVAAIIEQVLAKGEGGDPADGVSFLEQSVSVLRPDESSSESSSIFDPCAGLADCQPWDGFDEGTLPDFATVLGSEHGAWAVVGVDEEAESVCSSFTQPCATWNSGDPDTWGVEPTTAWEDALWGRTSLLFGYPLQVTDSPTGEAGFGTGLPAYEWSLIPHPGEFGSATNDGSELLVSLCADASASGQSELMVQKGSTILTESTESSWCDPNGQLAGDTSLLQRLVSFLSPLPAPLNAVAALAKGPGSGGLAGSFTDFYGVDIPTAAVIAVPSQPADGHVGEPIMAVDFTSFRVLTHTSSMGKSPLENAEVTIEVIGNSGLIPSENEVCIEEPDGEEFTCDGFTLTGFTQSDEEADPGTLLLPLVFTKTGQYSLCFTAELDPLQFGEVCTEKFNIRP